MVEANHKFLDLLKLYRPNDEIIKMLHAQALK